MSDDFFPARQGAAKFLVVHVHGFFGKPENSGGLREAISERYPDADILVPRMPFGLRPRKPRRVHYRDWPLMVAADLLRRVSDVWEAGAYERVVLVGQSMGGVFVRKLYVLACGETDEAPFSPAVRRRLGVSRVEATAWAGAVDRIVLLAAMNRGWTISHHLSMGNAILWWLGVMVTRFAFHPFRREPLAMSVKRGSPMITQLRVQSLHMRRRARLSGGPGGAPVVQLLGSIDDMVSPDDSVDLVTGQDFYYLEVPRTGHTNASRFDDGEAGLGRKRLFQDAISLPAAKLEHHPQRVTAREYRLDEDPTIEHVVFVIHGIRDKGYWTRKVYNQIERAWPGDKTRIISETSSYGYFPMIPFILPARRRAKVEWLMDEYTEAVARYPNASFSYVGHSNGTYLLAKALEEYPSVRFTRVVFAGSVVRRDYAWDAIHDRGQVDQVLNLVASRDTVVAFFPGALETVGADIGSGGHRGFAAAGGPVVDELSEMAAPFVSGGHGHGVAESMWPTIARFVATGAIEPPADPGVLTDARPRWLRILSHPPLVWVGFMAAALLIGGGGVVVAWLFGWWALALYAVGMSRLLNWI